MGKTEQYWNTFSEEKTKQRSELWFPQQCRGDIGTLVRVIKEHNEKYNILTNNCQDFADKIWTAMQ